MSTIPHSGYDFCLKHIIFTLLDILTYNDFKF